MGAEIDLSDFSLGSRLRTTAHDTGMSTWARLSPDLGTQKATDAAYAVGHALSDALDVLKAAAPLIVAAELDRLVESNRNWRSTTKGFLAAERAVHDYWITKLERRASELRGEAQNG